MISPLSASEARVDLQLVASFYRKNLLFYVEAQLHFIEQLNGLLKLRTDWAIVCAKKYWTLVGIKLSTAFRK